MIRVTFHTEKDGYQQVDYVKEGNAAKSIKVALDAHFEFGGDEKLTITVERMP